jgi:hypothetical protein
MTTYRVHVTREGDQWLADVPELDGASTYASNLTALDRFVREVIALAADLPDSDMPEIELDWAYDIGDQLVEQANALRAERVALATREQELEQATRALAIKLTSIRGFSVRDTGPLLGISHQRVSQITPAAERTGTPAARAPHKAAAKRTRKKASQLKVAAQTSKLAPLKIAPSQAAPRKITKRKGLTRRAATVDPPARKEP